MILHVMLSRRMESILFLERLEFTAGVHLDRKAIIDHFFPQMLPNDSRNFFVPKLLNLSSFHYVLRRILSEIYEKLF